MKYLVFIIILISAVANANEESDFNYLLNKKKRSVEEFKRLNNIYLQKGEYDLVKKNMKNFPNLNNEYNKQTLEDLYYDNKLEVSSNIMLGDKYNGSNYSFFYSRKIKGINSIGFGFKNEDRNFNGVVKSASQISLNYMKKTSLSSNYEARLDYSSSNTFLPEVNFSNTIYFQMLNDNSTFLGLSVQKHSQKDFYRSYYLGNEFYYKKNIFHSTLFFIDRKKTSLMNMNLGHTYYFNYRSLLKTSFSFGNGVDDEHLFGSFSQFDIKYTHKFHKYEPYFGVSFYNSSFRKETQIGGGLVWKF